MKKIIVLFVVIFSIFIALPGKAQINNGESVVPSLDMRPIMIVMGDTIVNTVEPMIISVIDGNGQKVILFEGILTTFTFLEVKMKKLGLTSREFTIEACEAKYEH